MILRKMSPLLRVEIIYQPTAIVASVDAEPIELAHIVGDLMVEWVPESGGNAGSGYKVIVTREVPPCAYAIPNDSIIHIHELPLDTPPPDESPRASEEKPPYRGIDWRAVAVSVAISYWMFFVLVFLLLEQTNNGG